MELTFYNVITVVIVLWSLYMSYQRHMKKPKKLESDKWQEVNALTKELGLTFAEHSNEHYNGGWIHGSYQNVAINIQDESTFHNRGKYSYVTIATLYEAFIGEEYNIEGLEVFREDLLSKASKAFGSKDIQVGHEEIDKAFIIKANSCQEARTFFANPSVRHYFLELIPPEEEAFRFERNTLILDFPRSMLSEQKFIRNRLELLTRCAHAMANTDHQSPQQQTLPPPTLPPNLDHPTELENTHISW